MPQEKIHPMTRLSQIMLSVKQDHQLVPQAAGERSEAITYIKSVDESLCIISLIRQAAIGLTKVLPTTSQYCRIEKEEIANRVLVSMKDAALKTINEILLQGGRSKGLMLDVIQEAVLEELGNIKIPSE